MKRFLVCVLMLGLFLALLCACTDVQTNGSGTSGNTDESSVVTNPKETTPDTGNETTTDPAKTEIPEDEQFVPSQDGIDENWTPNY